MTESEKLAYTRTVEEIDEGGFVQQNFKSSRDGKAATTKDTNKEDGEFNFGTQAELSARANKFIPLTDDSLFSPHVSFTLLHDDRCLIAFRSTLFVECICFFPISYWICAKSSDIF